MNDFFEKNGLSSLKKSTEEKVDISDSDDDFMYEFFGTRNADFRDINRHVRCMYPFATVKKNGGPLKRKRREHQNCYLCRVELKKHVTTSCYCQLCDLPLCNKKCFDKYHERIFRSRCTKAN